MKIVLICFCFILSSCAPGKEIKSSEVPQGFMVVTIRDYSGFDGCGFLLVKDDSTRFEVVNFPDSLKQNGKELFVRTGPVKDFMSICMSGKPVRLIEARYRTQ